MPQKAREATRKLKQKFRRGGIHAAAVREVEFAHLSAIFPSNPSTAAVAVSRRLVGSTPRSEEGQAIKTQTWRKWVDGAATGWGEGRLAVNTSREPAEKRNYAAFFPSVTRAHPAPSPSLRSPGFAYNFLACAAATAD